MGSARTLAQTGGVLPWLPLAAGLLALGAGTLFTVRRRMTA
ncbi:MAG: LPXTG cell wall anchor domain-containing protein [Microbacterium sp.]